MIFDGQLRYPETGTAMRTKLTPSYACLSIGYLEETVLFPKLLSRHFSLQQCDHIERHFKRYMDDVFIPLDTSIDFEILMNGLNSLNSYIE